jgi:hypothetical protein
VHGILRAVHALLAHITVVADFDVAAGVVERDHRERGLVEAVLDDGYEIRAASTR